MMAFAKLFENNKYGQILVKIDRKEHSGPPEVRFWNETQEDGMVTISHNFKDAPEGWDDAEKYFEACDEACAINNIEAALKALGYEQNKG